MQCTLQEARVQAATIEPSRDNRGKSMRVWGKSQAERKSTFGVARAAVEGMPRHDLLKEAVRSLLATGMVDRVGVWVESGEDASVNSRQVISFRGIVEEKEGDATPAEWSRLSPEPPLPAELLVGLQTVEQELSEPPEHPVIAPLLEMRRVLWVPVQMHGILRGLLFVGRRKKQARLPRALLESLAAELALAMGLEDERRLGREHRDDTSNVRHLLAALVNSEWSEDILDKIVKHCTQKGAEDSDPAAVFAAIGRLESAENRRESLTSGVQSLRFSWHGSSPGWICALESDSLRAVSRRALESHQVAGSAPGATGSRGDVECVVSFPLEAAGESLGVLVAGIRRSAATLAAVDRLELSAALATSALLQLKRREQASERELRLQEALAAVEKRPEPIPKVQNDEGLAEILNVIEWLEEGVVVFGANEKVRVANTRFGQIMGLSPEELAAIETFDDLIVSLSARTVDSRDFTGSWHRSDRKAQSAVREEIHLVRPVPRLIERAARPILDEKGQVLGRVEVYRDLTAQRVFQSKLLQTEKLAEVGQMVTGIAHELSNPLTSILGYAQRLLLRRDPAGNSSEARQIFQEAERASAILRQLLLSARESRPERHRVALNQVVSRTVELQRFNTKAGNIRVQLDLDPVLPFVHGDAGQLQQVLMNLIANARHAIEEQGKGGTIRVRTRRVGEKRVLLEVSDDGPGIPQVIQARIFDPFFTTKPAGVGTGLGLAIVLGIVREHGGKLHLTSNLGEGTVFSIELPAMGAVDIPLPGAPLPAKLTLKSYPAPKSLEAAHAGSVLSAWAGTQVLVLEDEPTVARLIADVLEDEGLRVDVLLDPREALDRVAHEQYALAICDMKMPELDGEHFYQALDRAQNSLRDRFLFVTGDVLAPHTRDFLQRNQLPYVAKPFRVEELMEKVREILEAASPREPSHAPVAKRNAARK
jgi:signal transduction histidine kinase/ActR/RegA family two-component response regulator